MRSHLVSLTLVSALAIAACGSDDTSTPASPDTAETSPTTAASAPTTEAPVETAAPTTELAPETTEAALRRLRDVISAGPYDVGVTTITIDTDTDRPLTLDVWFPVDDTGDAPLNQYTLIPGVYYESPVAVAGAELVVAEGSFPLVVYSHGSGGLRYIASYYTEAIASHGYVVAAPDHTGNTAADRLLGAEADFDVTALNRPNDVVATIDAMLDPSNVGLVGSIDTESIAVTGHSFGGFTSLAVAGGYENPIGSFVVDEPRRRDHPSRTCYR